MQRTRGGSGGATVDFRWKYGGSGYNLVVASGQKRAGHTAISLLQMLAPHGRANPFSGASGPIQPIPAGRPLSVVFVSHSSLDKGRIKIVTDRLLREERVRLWIDRPDEMGYTIAELDSGRILPIWAGEAWRRRIRHAALNSDCVLLLASNRVTDVERKVWHEEILVGHAREVLVAARLEKDVDLKRIAVVDDITSSQTLDVFLPPGTSDETATAAQKESVELLVRHVLEMLKRPRAGGLQGAFTSKQFSYEAPVLPRDHVDKLLGMLDREREVAAIAGSSTAIGVVGAARSARADVMLRRLPEIELPCRSTNAPWQRQRASAINLQSVRAEYIQGRITDTDGQWARDHVPWTVAPRDRVDTAVSTFIWSVYERVSRLVAPDVKAEPSFVAEVEKRKLSKASLCRALNRLEQSIFLQTEFNVDDKALRKVNRAFLNELSEWLEGVPVGSFRLLVHAIQSDAKPRWFGRSSTAWLEDIGRLGKMAVVTLDQVRRSELSAWGEMMTLILHTSDDEIAGVLDQVYRTSDTMARLPAATLAERLAPEVSRMRLRTSENSVRPQPHLFPAASVSALTSAR